MVRRDKVCFRKIVITFRGKSFDFVNSGSANWGKTEVFIKGECNRFLILIIYQTIWNDKCAIFKSAKKETSKTTTSVANTRDCDFLIDHN